MRKILPLAVAAVLAAAGCAGSEAGGDGPIVVGSVNALSGAATFPEASQAAKAVFDAANAAGGVNGRKIEYKAIDDKGDPAAAAAAAREVVGGDDAVALVGSSSLIECEINAKYYEQQKILSVQGIGVDPACFSSPNIAPVNVGPFHDMTLTLLYGSETLKLDNICALLEIAGNTLPAYQAAIDEWTKITGKKLKYVDATVPYGGSDYTSYIVKARAAGCRAITVNPVEPDSIGQLKAAQAQGWNDVTWLLLTSVYSENYAKAIANAGAGVYVPAEFYPFTDAGSPQTKDWRDLMTKNKIPLTSFSQGGYLAAKYFLDVVRGIKGDITRESVTKALREMKPVSDPMVGTPYVFGPARTHHDNTAGWPIKLASGTNKWELAAQDWLRIPRS
ncbi:branched-chain amino acid transport system substrate-binding protein [Amycolatopsis pretoriensis]|uniref:Branched-chain amino acid transport system substrate-binding protein n=1 Tax=Amycolatopsis pretoriensis TaxID=218821 RepID=A0A1H5Q6T3_9PSEU|nr:ABC transporter substrate-binding protein [Amycolatopsis pretoriensis]SEF21594.1 branched-chain amino acid transport system substrate-binding protein [Amycolatopsis pretoriensis]